VVEFNEHGHGATVVGRRGATRIREDPVVAICCDGESSKTLEAQE
jgi:hypothetical protein